MTTSLSAQQEWALQPWVQVEGKFGGQQLGGRVSYLGKKNDSTLIAVGDGNGTIYVYQMKSSADTIPKYTIQGNSCLLGDFNGDGIKDLAVSGNPTRIYLGKSPGVFDTVPFFVKYQENNGAGFGIHLAVGKINGDIYDDLVITDVGYPNGTTVGRVYLFLGGVQMDTIPDCILNGSNTLSYFGWNIATGDLNNDGFDDIIVRGYDGTSLSESGRFCYIKIYLGGNSVDTTMWRYIKGSNSTVQGLACFDVNGDGKKDLLWTTYSTKDSMISVYTHFSQIGNIDTVPSLVIPNGRAANITDAGDMNGDGYNDILISDDNSDQGGYSYVFEYSGGPKMDTHFDAAVGLGGGSNIGNLGSIAGIGDVNNDGYDDIVVGAPFYQWGSNRGYFAVFLGSKNIPVTKVQSQNVTTPLIFALSQNYPNPFNPTTTIGYELSVTSYVTLRVFDLLGREVAVLVNKEQKAGNYTATFDARKLSGGIYFYRLTAVTTQARIQTETKRMTLIK